MASRSLFSLRTEGLFPDVVFVPMVPLPPFSQGSCFSGLFSLLSLACNSLSLCPLDQWKSLHYFEKEKKCSACFNYHPIIFLNHWPLLVESASHVVPMAHWTSPPSPQCLPALSPLTPAALSRAPAGPPQEQKYRMQRSRSSLTIFCSNDSMLEPGNFMLRWELKTEVLKKNQYVKRND